MIELERIRSDTSVKIEEWLVEIDDLKERSKFHIPGTKEDDERLDAIACRESRVACACHSLTTLESSSSSISYIHETHAKKDREREQDWIERGVTRKSTNAHLVHRRLHQQRTKEEINQALKMGRIDQLPLVPLPQSPQEHLTHCHPLWWKQM